MSGYNRSLVIKVHTIVRNAVSDVVVLGHEKNTIKTKQKVGPSLIKNDFVPKQITYDYFI